MTFSPNKKPKAQFERSLFKLFPFGVQDGVQAFVYIVID
jgi:hypothetical protein